MSIIKLALFKWRWLKLITEKMALNQRRHLHIVRSVMVRDCAFCRDAKRNYQPNTMINRCEACKLGSDNIICLSIARFGIECEIDVENSLELIDYVIKKLEEYQKCEE